MTGRRYQPFWWVTRCGLLLVVGLLLLPVTAPAQSTRQQMQRVAGEVAQLSERLNQLDTELGRLAKREAELAGQVAKLKRAGSGWMNESKLKKALKDLRTLLAKRRTRRSLEKILRTTLTTRQLTLQKLSSKEARRLMIAANWAANSGDVEQAMELFEQAYDHLQISSGMARKQHSQPRLMTGTASVRDIVIDPQADPDELRELAEILRDNGEQIRALRRQLSTRLAAMQAEQASLIRLLEVVPGGHHPGEPVLTALNHRIDRLRNRIRQYQQQFITAMNQATDLDRTAAQQELRMYDELAELPEPGR